MMRPPILLVLGLTVACGGRTPPPAASSDEATPAPQAPSSKAMGEARVVDGDDTRKPGADVRLIAPDHHAQGEVTLRLVFDSPYAEARVLARVGDEVIRPLKVSAPLRGDEVPLRLDVPRTPAEPLVVSVTAIPFDGDRTERVFLVPRTPEAPRDDGPTATDPYGRPIAPVPSSGR